MTQLKRVPIFSICHANTTYSQCGAIELLKYYLAVSNRRRFVHTAW